MCLAVYGYAKLAVSSPPLAETIASTHCTDPWTDGQAEWHQLQLLYVMSVNQTLLNSLADYLRDLARELNSFKQQSETFLFAQEH